MTFRRLTDLPLAGKRVFIRADLNVPQDEAGNINLTHSISAGLDYAAIGPGLAARRARGQWQKTEGILPALESAHAVAHVLKLAPRMKRNQVIVVNLSGRGDKDVMQVAKMRGVKL